MVLLLFRDKKKLITKAESDYGAFCPGLGGYISGHMLGLQKPAPSPNLVQTHRHHYLVGLVLPCEMKIHLAQRAGNPQSHSGGDGKRV